MNVLDGQALDERGLYSLEDALRTVPGVEINSYGDTVNTNVRIRGMGTLQKVSGEDSSVTLSLDGLPMSVGDITTSTFDVERVGVLKGPQGTLFGSDSEAGAINIITRKPTRHLEGYARGMLLWQPTAATRLTLSAQHESLRQHPSVQVLRPHGSRPVMDAPPWIDGDRRKANRLSAVLEHDLDFAMLTAPRVPADAGHGDVPVLRLGLGIRPARGA